MPDIFGLRKRAQTLHDARRHPARRDRIGEYPDGGCFFQSGLDEHLGTFRIVYEQGRRPTSGAMSYAYMSFAPQVVSPCGAGFDVQGPGFSPYQPPPAYAGQTARVQGVGLQANGIYSMPLTVPSSSSAPMARGGV